MASRGLLEGQNYQIRGWGVNLIAAALAGVRGLEPLLAVLETTVLPLNDTPSAAII